MPKKAQQVEWTQEQIAAIQVWSASKNQLDVTKAEELELRLKVVRIAPFNQHKEEGGQTLPLANGWRIALDRPMYYSIETKDNNKVVECVNALAAKNPLAAQDIIKWVPVLSESGYKKLSDEEQVIMAPVVTIKPGTPAIELKPPATPKD
jgi:hypothetical protein